MSTNNHNPLQKPKSPLFVEVHTWGSPIFGTMLLPFKKDIVVLLSQKIKHDLELEDEMDECLHNRQCVVDKFVEGEISLDAMNPFIDKLHQKMDTIDQIKAGKLDMSAIKKESRSNRTKKYLINLFSRKK